MKALELTVYERQENGDYRHPSRGYYIPHIDINYCIEDKRFTDAELAAEVHSQTIHWMRLQRDGYEYGDEFERAETLHRFATHPHALST